jgi:hypothetical protein
VTALAETAPSLRPVFGFAEIANRTDREHSRPRVRWITLEADEIDQASTRTSTPYDQLRPRPVLHPVAASNSLFVNLTQAPPSSQMRPLAISSAVHNLTFSHPAMPTSLVFASTTPSVTAYPPGYKQPTLERQLVRWCASWSREVDEDGSGLDLIRELSSLLASNGVELIAILATVVRSLQAPEEVLHLLLRWLALIDDEPSRLARRWLLEDALSNQSRWVRDGAALGLATMKDPHAIPFVKAAHDSELVKELRADLAVILSRLEALAKWPRSSSSSTRGAGIT